MEKKETEMNTIKTNLKHFQKTLEMTETEWNEYLEGIGRNLIRQWNKAGSKGFPPSSGIRSIYNQIALAERAGYELPRQADTILSMSTYKLAREAMLNKENWNV